MESRGDLFYLLGKTLTDKEVIQHYLFVHLAEYWEPSHWGIQ